MNCSFKILWFEDEPGWFRMQSSRINRLMEGHCLSAIINRKDGDGFDIAELRGNEYDLILMDYRLASGNTGDAIISCIRAHDILTDILFYSSQFDEMLDAISNISPPIDGVYYANRKLELFQAKIEMLINKIVRRSEDLINLRGFVLDSSCDFEMRIQDVLNIAWQKFTEPEHTILNSAVRNTINSNLVRQGKGIEKIIAADPIFPSAVNEKHVFSHSDRLYILTKVILLLQTDYGFVPKPEHLNFKVNYEESISQYRNAFGHKQAGENTIEICKLTLPIDETLHQKMRTNINIYDSLIGELEIFLTQNV